MLFASWQVSLTTNVIETDKATCCWRWPRRSSVAPASSAEAGPDHFHGVLGGLVIGGIYNGLYLLGVSSQWIDVVVAAVLLAAAAIDVLSRRGAPRQA